MTDGARESRGEARGEAPALTRPMAIALALLNVSLACYSALVPGYLRSASTSVTANMLLVLGWVSLVVVASFIEAVAVRRLLARGGWRGRLEMREEERGDAPKPWKDFNLPLTIALAVLLGLNMLVFDQLSGGFFVSEQQSTDATTRMRSPDPAERREGVTLAARLPTPRVREGLAALIAGPPSPERALAAWALDEVGTPGDAEPLLRLLERGDEGERAAAAIALGRLRSEGLPAGVAPLLTRPGEPIEAYLVGLGLLGDRHATLLVMELMLEESTAPDHLALAAWALGRIGDPRGCPLLVDSLGPEADPLSCAAAAAVARIECPEAVGRLRDAFDGAGLEDRCEPRTSADTDGTPIALWRGGLYRVVLLEAIARSSRGDAREWLARVARDPTEVPQVRDLAARAAGL